MLCHRATLPGQRLSSFSVLLLTVGVGGVVAQPSPSVDAGDPFRDVIEVRVVNLEAVVTDRAGRRVGGLEASDFRLFVDGEETPIDYFSEIRDGEAQRPQGEVEAAPGVVSGEEMRTNFLVYVDDNHTLKIERDLVVRGLIEDLALLGPNDRMAVVVQSGPELVMLSSWTGDRDRLRGALGALLDAGRFGGSLRSPLLGARQSAIHEHGGVGLVGGDARLELELAITGAVSTLRSFAQPAGRKVMLLLAGDWPMGAFRESGGSLAIYSDLDVLRSLVETANLLGYTLYPVGLDGGTDSIWRNANLRYLAGPTGGLPLFERGATLVDAVIDTRSYYWLGFVPEMNGDDARHDVRLEVLRPGLEVRNRRGYVDLSRATQLAMMVQSALLFGSEVEDDLEIELGRAKRWGLRKMEVPISVRIPLGGFASLPASGGRRAEEIRLELRFAVVDSTGSQADIPVIPIVLRGRRDPGDAHVYETELHMRRRPHGLLVSVHDPVSGTTLNARTELSFRSTRDERDP